MDLIGWVRIVGRLYRRKGMTIGDYDPMRWPRLAVGWLAMQEVLSDGKWHFRDDLALAGVNGSDLKMSTCQNMLSRLSAPDGPLERKGSVKNRRYRLVIE